MQSETADFVPGAATLRTGRNIGVVFDSCHVHSSYVKHGVVHKTGSTYRVALKNYEPRSQVTCTENLMKFGRVVSEIFQQTGKRTNGQTIRETYKRTD